MKENNNFDLTLKVTTITKSMVIGGLVLIILTKLIPSQFEISDEFWILILAIAEIIGTTIFSAGLVSVIVEISTIKSLVSHAFKNILSGNFELDGLSQIALMKLKHNIALKLLDNQSKDLENSPYKYEDKLLNSVNEKYYEHHNITYHITPDEKNNCFHIKTKIDYKIVNKNLIDNHFDVRLKLFKIGSGNNFSASVVINGNNENINNILTIEPVKHHSESTYYDSKIVIHKDLDGVRNKIKAELNYDVPLFDICQSFKISAPTKNMEHKFYINEDVQTKEKWQIQANAYSTFYHRQDEEGSNFKVEQNVDDSLIIRYTDWALVGNGYCVFYQKKG